MEWFRRMWARSDDQGGRDGEDLPGSSVLAIRRECAAKGGPLRAHLYRHAGERFLVTSVMSVPGSVILEVGNPSVVPIDAADEEIGSAICRHLLLHDARPPPNLHELKSTDWPVFRASGDKSVTRFKSKSSRVFVETAGDHLFLDLETAPLKSLHANIRVKGTAPLRHDELGAVVRKTLRAADALRAAEII